MNLFYVAKKKPKLLHLFPPILFLAALLIFALCAGKLSDSNTNQEYHIVQNALERSITQCYAIEGTYPPNIEYLRDNYGFTYNTTHFYIDYQYIGGNLRPDVTIITKESEN